MSRRRSFGWAVAALLALGVAKNTLAETHAAAPQPVVVQDGVALIGLENLVPFLIGDRRLVRLDFPNITAPVLREAQDEAAELMLRRLYGSGRAAGNHGDLYENRDRGHSALPDGDFPQLTRVIYGPELREAGVDYGAAQQLIFAAPLIGNSSTALTGGDFWRSQPRAMLTRDGGAGRLYQNYLAGQIHVYPEHRDHDPEFGDLLPANTPYYLISQGSSGSDRAHLRVLALILAAFQPETKDFLREQGLIASTVQMVYRRSRAPVLSRAAYQSGQAHPSVFDAKDLRPERAVALANALTPAEVPPMVRLAVTEESWAVDERLFDTPGAVSRIWRGEAFRREMVVSAENTNDPNGRALQFEWALLRGDPDRVQITPLDGAGRRARIVIDWQEPRLVPGMSEISTPRVDIGVFAVGDMYDSAPGFVSVLLPGHEQRDYAAGQAGETQLVERERKAGAYADPAIFPDRP